MTVTKEEMDKWFEFVDPWQYETNPEDLKRKKIILSKLEKLGPFERALDIACGEGFITRDIPAKVIHGLELSDNAASRFPKIIKRVLEPEGEYDLVMITGALYPEYDYNYFIDLINKHALNYILVSNIKDREVKEVSNILGAQIYTSEFPYREFTQKLRIFKK